VVVRSSGEPETGELERRRPLTLFVDAPAGSTLAELRRRGMAVADREMVLFADVQNAASLDWLTATLQARLTHQGHTPDDLLARGVVDRPPVSSGGAIWLEGECVGSCR
jgi:hypothetical protein